MLLPRNKVSFGTGITGILVLLMQQEDQQEASARGNLPASMLPPTSVEDVYKALRTINVRENTEEVGLRVSDLDCIESSPRINPGHISDRPEAFSVEAAFPGFARVASRPSQRRYLTSSPTVCPRSASTVID